MKVLQSTRTSLVQTWITARHEWPPLIQSFVNDKWKFKGHCQVGEEREWQYFVKLENAEKWCKAKHRGQVVEFDDIIEYDEENTRGN